MAKLLVTGGAGFIGANFVRHRLANYPEDKVVVLDALTNAGNKASLETLVSNPNYSFVQADIVDNAVVSKLLKSESIDTLVHFAAESHVDRSIVDPHEFVRTNVLGTQSLLEACRQNWLSEQSKRTNRFHHVSTDEVYGTLGPDDSAFTEETPYAPNSPYAASKAGSDHLVRAYHETYGLQVTTSNCSNNYGPFQFPEKLIPLTITNALTGKTLPVYGDGSNIRDWLYVEDHCKGIDRILTHGSIGETYNIGACNEKANINIVKEICEKLDRLFQSDSSLASRFPHCPAAAGTKTDELIQFVKDRPGHDWRYAICPDKTRDELGFEATEDFDSGLDKTIDWMLNNEDWWRAILDGSYRQI